MTGRPRGVWRIRSGAALAVLLIAAAARAQIVNELELERPLTMEDAHPLPYRAVSSSVDWTSNWREGRNDYGPGFSFTYGLARALEVGAAVRYVSSPDVNATRGISSGDLNLHALYGITPETASLPALAFRVGVEFPTGLDSKGTDLRLGGLATRTFGAVRLHANFGWTRLGDTGPTERKDRLEGVAGFDVITSPRGVTDTLLLGDVVVRTNPVRDAETIVTLEAGGRFRIGSRTVFFAGMGSDVTGSHDRAKFRLRAGITYVF
ncbi:MAG TPA: hypothetical protein VJA66_10255 [Thermoanaerobaculia bacterium]